MPAVDRMYYSRICRVPWYLLLVSGNQMKETLAVYATRSQFVFLLLFRSYSSYPQVGGVFIINLCNNCLNHCVWLPTDYAGCVCEHHGVKLAQVFLRTESKIIY